MNIDLLRLAEIVSATLAAGVGSVWIAGLAASRGPSRELGSQDGRYLLSLAAGALLATAFLHLLPEAFKSEASPGTLFGLLLGGLLLFFLLDKAELWHHGHEHAHRQAHPVPHREPSEVLDFHSMRGSQLRSEETHRHDTARPRGIWSALFGDSVHCFSDGLLIASAFMADLRLGAVASAAVLVHEIPHHIGDLILVRQGSATARAAFLKVALAGSATTIGGVSGFWLISELNGWIPYFLVLAGSSFVYVALADLIPQLQTHLQPRQAGFQVMSLLAGILLVGAVSHIAEPDQAANSALAAPGATPGETSNATR